MKLRKNQWTYKVIATEQEDDLLKIKVGNEWKEGKVLKYEGFYVYLPIEAEGFEELVFGIVEVKEGSEYGTYDLVAVSQMGVLPKETAFDYKPGLKVYRGEEQEIITDITVSSKLLAKWTGMMEKELRSAFRSVSFAETYTLLTFVPRTITLTKKEVVIDAEIGEQIKGGWLLSIRDKLVKGEHPIDR